MPITDTWIGGTGDWDIPTNWSVNAKPGALDGAVFNSTSNATLTNVEFENIASLQMSTTSAVVGIQGELTVGGAHLNGVSNFLDVTAGALTVNGGGLIAGQFVTEASGTVHLTNQGTYQWNGSGSTQNVDMGRSINDTFQFSTQFGGTISNFYAGGIISYSGAVNSVVVGDNSVTFNATNGQSYVINLTGAVYNATDLVVFGNSIETTLLPPVTINSSFPTGYALDPNVQGLNIGTAAVIGGKGVTTTALATITNLGQIQATSNGVTLPDGGTLTNGSPTNHTALVSGFTGVVLKGVGTVTNYGVITGTNGTAVYFNDVGARLIEESSGVLNGAVTGGGGTLELGNKAGPGTLSGLGSTLKSFGVVTVDKGSTWTLSGASTVAAGEVLNNAGILDVQGNIANSGQVNNLAGATMALEGDFGITSTTSGGFSNAGLFQKLAGAGTSIVSSHTGSVIDTGTLDVETGTLELTGAAVSVTGLIKGAGTIEFGPGATTLGAGASITASTFKIAGTGAHVTVAHSLTTAASFSAGTGTELTINTGDILTLTGPASFTHDTVDGAGSLTTNGATSVATVTLGGTARWSNGGTLTDAATLTVGDNLGDKAMFVNQATGVFDVAGNAGIGIGTAATSSFTNQGMLAKTAGGTSALALAVINSGTLESASGTLDLMGQVTNTGSVLALAGTVMALEGDIGISTTTAGTFSNAGTFKKISGTGTSIVKTGTATLTDTGTLDVETGTLELTGATISVSGKILGAGTIEFGAGATTLGLGTSISTAALTIAGTGAHVTLAHGLSYVGAFSASAGTELTINTGNILTLSGAASFVHDTIDGAGQVTTKGPTSVAAVTLGGTVQWNNGGTLTETSTLTIGDGLGDKATFVNQAAGVFDLAGNTNIGIGTAATSSFTNQGLLAKTSGGTSTISVTVANTGTIESASGTIDLQQAITGNGGTLKIDAGKIIQADAAVSSGQTVTFGQGGDRLVLTDAEDFAAKLSNFTVGDKLDLRQFAPATTTVGFVENAAMTQGTLTVTDGALQATITLLGQYSASQFQKSSDGAGGTFITDPPVNPMLIAAPHA